MRGVLSKHVMSVFQANQKEQLKTVGLSSEFGVSRADGSNLYVRLSDEEAVGFLLSDTTSEVNIEFNESIHNEFPVAVDIALA